MTPEQISLFRRRLRQMAESLFLHDVIDSRQCLALFSFPDSRRGRSSAEALFSRGEVALPKYSLRLQMKILREIDGREFPHIQIMITGKRRRLRVCFVGHRFLPGVIRTLRWNLRHVLEPYNVRMDWSGKDIRSVQIFDDIVNRIRRADFCIFDNRGTAGRPNVYVEVGVAYAVKKPFILFDYATRRTQAIPTDLSHSFAIRYRNYQQLFPEFYARLPLFFRRNFSASS